MAGIGRQTGREDIVLRAPRPTDGGRLHKLVESCPPLEVNSPYCYLILCSHFSETCTLAERRDEFIAFQTGYRRPDEPDVLYVWQIGVSESGRRQGLGGRMLDHVIKRQRESGVRFVELTVTESNAASRALFHSAARRLNAPIEEAAGFGPEHFAPSRHDREFLLRIGPFATENSGTKESIND